MTKKKPYKGFLQKVTIGYTNSQSQPGTNNNGTEPVETTEADAIENNKPYTRHGSIEDWKIIKDQKMGGRYKLNSFGIIAPKGTRYTGEWNEPEIKYFN